ncbi:MAG: AmmeMemoRadiSam system radical SAM enzyme [Methanobacteriaceae archaeon]
MVIFNIINLTKLINSIGLGDVNINVEAILYNKFDLNNMDTDSENGNAKCNANIDNEIISSENNKNLGAVQCHVCNHRCIIATGSYGICKARKNENGTLYLCNFEGVSSYNRDPIEKKPFYHFLPGTYVYSLSGFGCNMHCLNCQNHIISQKSQCESSSVQISPETAVEIATLQGCKSIAFTYNEPTIHLEYDLQVAKLAHNENLKTVYISNGYMTEEALETLTGNIDAMNIDLKAMSNNFYKDICGARLDPILDNLKTIYKNNIHLEVTNLIIPKHNDSLEMIKDLTDFIANELSCEVPLHFSRFTPMYKMISTPPTQVESLEKAREIAKESGLKYVYLGNIPEEQNTYCDNCGELLIRRYGYNIKNNLENKKYIIDNEDMVHNDIGSNIKDKCISSNRDINRKNSNVKAINSSKITKVNCPFCGTKQNISVLE